MNKKVMQIVVIALIAVGCFFGYLAKTDAGKLTSFAILMFGAGLGVANMWETKKPEVKGWIMIVSMACVGISCFFAGMMKLLTEDNITKLIGYIFIFIFFIVGIILPEVAKKVAEKKN